MLVLIFAARQTPNCEILPQKKRRMEFFFSRSERHARKPVVAEKSHTLVNILRRMLSTAHKTEVEVKETVHFAS